MSAMGQDFTQGAVLRPLIAFSTPIMVANLLQISYQVVDSLWVGNLLGAHALGAVAISSTIVVTVLSFVTGMNNAALAILAQQQGRGDQRGLARYLNAFIVVLFLIAMGLGLMGFMASGRVLQLLGTPDDILNQAEDYLRITFLGMLFLFGYNFIATVLRAMGDSKTPMRFVVVAVVLNAVLDPVLIQTFGLGIRGAALATVVSQGAAFSYGVIFVLRRGAIALRLPYRPAREEVRLILTLGIPSGLQMAVISAGSAAIMSVVTGFGGQIVGGFGAAQRVDSLIMLPAQALGIAVSTMAAQNIGRGQWDRVDGIARVAVRYNLAIMGAIAVVVMISAKWAIGLFVDEPEAIEFGANYVRITALCYPFLGINFVLNGVVRASGAMYQVLALNVISFWVLRFPLTALFASQFGSTGIGIGIGSSFIISSIVAQAYFRFGGWRERQLFDEPVARP